MSSAGTDQAPLTLRELWARIARRRLLLGGITVGVSAAVAAWAFTATPRYQSVARLRIESRVPSSSALADQMSTSVPGAGFLGLGRDDLETEVAVLGSRRMMDAMIDSLALMVRVVSPEGDRSRVGRFAVLDPDIELDGRLELKRQGDGRYSGSWVQGRDVPAVAPVLTPGVPGGIGGVQVTLRQELAAAGPERVVLQFLPRYRVHELLQRRLLIARQEGGSRLVEVSFEDSDRYLAAQVVDRLVTEYVAYTRRTEQDDDVSTVGQLRGQVDSTARHLAAAEMELRTFEERNRLIAPEEQATAQVKRISAISTHVDAISVERTALARTLAIIDQRSRDGAGSVAYRQLATFPSLITNRAIQDLLQSLVELENERALLGVRRTGQDAEYAQLTARIAEIERQLYQLGPQYLESLDQQLATTAATVQALTDTLQALPAAAMHYGRLVRDRTLSEATYLALQKQLKQAELRDVLRQERVRLVDLPRVANPRDKVFPRRGVMLVLGVVLGLVLALTAGLVAELWRAPAVAET
jgi:uncharacterized protein involved in exopolysaccharide biosynthesis